MMQFHVFTFLGLTCCPLTRDTACVLQNIWTMYHYHTSEISFTVQEKRLYETKQRFAWYKKIGTGFLISVGISPMH
jgi:hypothetical protein